MISITPPYTTFDSILSNDKSEKKLEAFYRVESSMNIGVTDESTISWGFTLVYDEELSDCDLLQDEIHMVGDSSTIILPENMQVGQLYRLVYTDYVRDWESGTIEDWKVTFVLIDNQTKVH